MLYAPNGRPIRKVSAPFGGMRRGMQVDAIALANTGAKVSPEFSRQFQNKLRNNAELRERIERADKMTGTKTLHLAMIERGEMSNKTEDTLMVNQKFGEKITEGEKKK